MGKVHEVEAPVSGGAGLSRTQPPLLECCAAKAIGSVATPAAGSVGADTVACPIQKTWKAPDRARPPTPARPRNPGRPRLRTPRSAPDMRLPDRRPLNV